MSTPNPRATVLIDGTRYYRPEGEPGIVVREDKIPATTRATLGEGRYDSYQDESYVAQFEFGGGLGQRRLFAGDQGLTGYADTRHGVIQPAWKLEGSPLSGSQIASHYFQIGTTLYCATTDGNVQTVGNTSQVTGFGTVLGVPKVSGNNVAFVVASGGVVYRYRPTVPDKTVVTPSGATIEALASYGQYIWAFGRKSVPQGPQGTQRIAGGYSGSSRWTTVQMNFTGEVKEGSALFFAFMYRKSSVATGDGSSPDIGLTAPGWTVLAQTENFGATTDDQVRGVILGYINRAGAGQRGPRIEVADKAAQFFQHFSYILYELEGMDEDGDRLLGAEVSAVNVASGTVSSVTSGTAPGGTVESIGIGGAMTDGGLTAPAGWSTVGGSISGAVIAQLEQTGGDFTFQDAAITAGYPVAFVASFRGNGITTSIARLAVFTTSDDGTSWQAIQTKIGTAIGTITDTFTDGSGFLWIATNNGLYRMSYEEIPFVDGTSKINILITGPIDHFDVPTTGAKKTGAELVVFEGILHYNEGASVRRYAPGGESALIWPPPDWFAGINIVKAICVVEGGIYFTAGNYLHVYNRGFHIVAENTTANIYNEIAYSAGRLYVANGQYYTLTYPGARRETYITSGDSNSWETGYWVSSLLDFDKPGLMKFLTELVTQVRFTDTANTGSIKVYVRDGAAGMDPAYYNGKVTELAWTLVGEHTVAEGGMATFRRGEWALDPTTYIGARAVYLRFEVIPGTSGIPSLEGYTINGVTVSPVRKIFTVPIELRIGQPDLEGNIAYDEQADLTAGVNHLDTLRQNSAPFTLVFDEGTPDAEAYLVVSGEQRDQLIERFLDRPQIHRVQIYRELP